MEIELPKHFQTWKHNEVVNEDTMRQLLTLKPSRVIDVGVGDGFYGKLVKYCFPKTFVLAVEKRIDYILNWKLDEIYDEVVCDDIVNVIDKLEGDLIIFGDVLEHLEKIDAVRVLSEAVKRFNYVLINSPVGFQPQEHHLPEEIHRCGFDCEDFEDYQVMEFHTYCDGTMFNCLLLGEKK